MKKARRSRRRRAPAAVSLVAATSVGLVAWLRARREHDSSERRPSMTEENKRIARRVIDEIFNEGRLEVADEVMATDSIGHDPALPEPTRGPAGLKQAVTGYRDAFPDLRVTINEQIGEGDFVCTRWTARGTHKGMFFGTAATGKEATVTGITIDRIANGRIAESWTNWDTLGLMQQLGMVPTMAPA